MVNGQKISKSLAMDANWIFLLVRTDKQAKNRRASAFCWFQWTRQHPNPQHRYGGGVLRDILRQRACAQGEI